MPHVGDEQRALTAADRTGTQPDNEVPGVHDVPRIHSRVEFQRGLLQALREFGTPKGLIKLLDPNGDGACVGSGYGTGF